MERWTNRLKGSPCGSNIHVDSLGFFFFLPRLVRRHQRGLTAHRVPPRNLKTREGSTLLKVTEQARGPAGSSPIPPGGSCTFPCQPVALH